MKFRETKNEILSKLFDFFDKYSVEGGDLSPSVWILKTISVLKSEMLANETAPVAIKIGVNVCYIISHLVVILKISTVEKLNALIIFLRNTILVNINIPYICMKYLGIFCEYC